MLNLALDKKRSSAQAAAAREALADRLTRLIGGERIQHMMHHGQFRTPPVSSTFQVLDKNVKFGLWAPHEKTEAIAAAITAALGVDTQG